jgi:ATP-binding cassette subfamily B protein/subfamily B ATP-binding cassette protein MsbA
MRIWRRKQTDRHAVFSEADAQNLKWFWHKYLKKNTPFLFVVFLMVAAQGLVYQQFLALTESGLTVIFENGSIGDLAQICGFVFLLFAIRAALSYGTPRMSQWLASNAVLEMRRDMITAYLRLDLSYFERTKTGDIILRLVNQADGLSNFVGQATVNAVRDFVTIIIISGYLVYKSPLLFSAAIIIIPCIVLMMQVVAHKIKDIQTKAENAFGDYMSGIEEMANGMRTVKISGQEEQEHKRLVSASEGIRNLMIRLQGAQALTLPSIDLVSAFVYVLVIGGGGYLVLSDDSRMDAAGLITFLLGLVILFDPLRLLAGFFGQLQAALILLAGVRSIHNLEPIIKNAPNAITDFDRSGDIALEDVTFHYEGAATLFEGLSLNIEGGKTTAIVGSTGSGKTTILSMLTRLYDVLGGSVMIDGKDIRQIDVRSLRNSFSVVAQDIVIFNDSIYENIRYVRPEATEDEIWAAAEAAEISDLMRERGDAELGPKGSQLSGGQKQRIAIARAFLRSAPILLLDEATSALDQRTEERIQSALRLLSEGKTTIIVAHRLSSIIHADKIYVLERGKLVEEGNHQSLMVQNGLYAAMYRSQKQGYN